jgi:hypothetical protein
MRFKINDHLAGSLPEDGEHILLVVLATQAQQHPALLEADHKSLQRYECRRETDAECTQLADDALPERVVAIDNYDFAARSFPTMDLPR